MRNNILGGLVIFFVVVTCLLMIDDITSSNTPKNQYYETMAVDELPKDQTDLSVTDNEE